jgi:hypothetical protein
VSLEMTLQMTLLRMLICVLYSVKLFFGKDVWTKKIIDQKIQVVYVELIEQTLRRCRLQQMSPTRELVLNAWLASRLSLGCLAIEKMRCYDRFSFGAGY